MFSSTHLTWPVRRKRAIFTFEQHKRYNFWPYQNVCGAFHYLLSNIYRHTHWKHSETSQFNVFRKEHSKAMDV